jgi:hypothetical protein
MIQKQIEMEFLWPHRGVQLSLDLDTEGCDIRENFQPARAAMLYGINNATLGMTTISPSLSVSPSNSVGELKIGVINIGIEKKPSVLQKVLYKLLGFKWSEK